MDHSANFGRSFAWAIALNLAFVVAEGTAGIVGNSMALIADAGHNLSDVLGLVLAWTANILSRKPPTRRFTYGLQGSSILAALANAVLLMVACGAIAWEAVGRLSDPPAVLGSAMMWVAAAGILINGATALLFARGRKGDLNIRGAFLHMMADAIVSAGVVMAGLLIVLTGLEWIDPLTSLVIVAVIIAGTWGLFRDSLGLALNAVPPTIDPDAVADRLGKLEGVAAVHHLHIWPMSTTANALTAHLVMPAGHPGDAFLAAAAHAVEHDFGISHATLQVEIGPSCSDDHCAP
jgi:cobalt-zinc-cadmium efflux system protein